MELPSGIGGVPLTVESAELEDGPNLCLLSKKTQERLGTRIDVEQRVADFRALGLYDLPLVETEGGHLAVSLLDFPDAAVFLDRFAFFNEKEDTVVNTDDADNYAEPLCAAVEYDGDAVEPVIEDVKVIDWVGDPSMRSATSRKQKKIDAMATDFEITENRRKELITGGSSLRRRRQLPRGRTFLKQLFCGFFGLTYTASMLRGYVCGEPLDLELGWDCATSAASGSQGTSSSSRTPTAR